MIFFLTLIIAYREPIAVHIQINFFIKLYNSEQKKKMIIFKIVFNSKKGENSIIIGNQYSLFCLLFFVILLPGKCRSELHLQDFMW